MCTRIFLSGDAGVSEENGFSGLLMDAIKAFTNYINVLEILKPKYIHIRRCCFKQLIWNPRRGFVTVTKDQVVLVIATNGIIKDFVVPDCSTFEFLPVGTI